MAGKVAGAVSRRLVESKDWHVLLFLLLAITVDYAERTLIGALGPTLESVFHFGNTTLGFLAAASNLVAALATIPFGLLTDRTRRTLLLAISLLIWALAVGVVGASVTLAMFFGARLFLGGIAAVTGPTTPSLIGDLVPADQRGRALGLIESGQLVGDGVGFLLAAVVTSFLSFRWSFWVLGIVGAILAVAFLRLREPERTASEGPAESGDGARQTEAYPVEKLVREAGIKPSRRAILKQDPETMSLWDAARYVLRVRTDVIVLAARAIGDYFLAGISTFGVIFATRQYRLTQQSADLAILVVGVGALIGFLVVGRAGDALLDRGHLTSRVWLGALGYILGPIPLFFALRSHTVWFALPLFALGAFFIGGAGPPLDAVRVDVVVPRLRGRSASVRQVLRAIAEGGAPIIFGLLSGVMAGGGSSGVQFAFLVTLPVLILSGLIVLIALRTYAPDIAAALASTEHDPEGHDAGDAGAAR